MTDIPAGRVDPGETCLNCDATLTGRYCSVCGQDAQGPPTRLAPLLASFVSNALGMEGRPGRSLATLLFYPGRLTRAFVAGHRVRYSHPVQIYLFCTAVFFLFHSFHPVVQLDTDSGRVESSLSAARVGTELSPAAMARMRAPGSSPEAFERRFDAAVSVSLPVLLVTLVGVTALLMAAQFSSERPLTHVIFALHWSAFYFTLEAVRQVLRTLGPWGGTASVVGSLVAVVYLLVAMRVVYRRGWAGSVLRALISVVVFALLLATWLWSTTLLGEAFA